MKRMQESAAEPGTYPPAVYAGPAAETAVPPSSLLWWAAATTVLGPVLGVLWWFASPGGGLYGDRANAESWLIRDLVLGGLQLLAGVVVGWLLTNRIDLPGAWQRVCAAVGGSMLGSVLAVLVGQGLGALFSGGDGEFPFVLRSLGVALVWPAAAALVVFLASLLGLLLIRRNR
ncbi:hypothetical protein ASH00_07670 [Arthrobacter sp. Soil782]|uniref:hypothetical protein n=1 Tax=Arthrobacter sp. Soil782 TaxID=1736410 RepID=UPI0007159513|nr:hypothetical protein [Arthrobacter sp. Soil782]KRF06138.1 hypothetical protein ASH00_07670 [Arthrobacter sp. Soil782]